MTAGPAHQNAAKVVKTCALELGFDLVRITSAVDFELDREVTIDRIRSGLMDGLPWFHQARVTRGASPEQLLPGARSVICLALNYFNQEPGGASTSDSGSAAGRVARYARGRDYHRVMKRMMRNLVAELSARLECDVDARWYVDDGPMLDRAAAARAGIGWFGKNTNILTSELGSWVFLGQVITDLELAPDPALTKTCGNCVRCIDACPTGAIVAPYVIDNARCISYLTIENRGPIPAELRHQMLDWVFGCDICQDVCPVNRKAQPAAEAGFGRTGLAAVDLLEILEMSEEEFRQRFSGTPIMRAKRVGLQRNACVALGNLADPSTIPGLAKALSDGETLVRCHAAWALGEIGGTEAIDCLEGAAAEEREAEVIDEIRDALQRARLKQEGGSQTSGSV